MAFAIYGSSQLFCVVWQVVLLASFAVITYAYLRIEECTCKGIQYQAYVITYAYLRIEEIMFVQPRASKAVITYAYLRIEDVHCYHLLLIFCVITYAYLRIEDFTLLCVFSATKL